MRIVAWTFTLSFFVNIGVRALTDGWVAPVAFSIAAVAFCGLLGEAMRQV